MGGSGGGAEGQSLVMSARLRNYVLDVGLWGTALFITALAVNLLVGGFAAARLARATTGRGVAGAQPSQGAPCGGIVSTGCVLPAAAALAASGAHHSLASRTWAEVAAFAGNQPATRGAAASSSAKAAAAHGPDACEKSPSAS